MIDAIDLFAGIGWGLAAQGLGLTEVGIDNDPAVCALRARHGLSTIRADVATLAPRGSPRGLIASPPCQPFSKAGDRKGLADPRGQLLTEVTRWALALGPDWVLCEQVPEVEPYWRWIARDLADIGYRTWVGQLNAADYGTPQIRWRAILMAHRRRAPTLPEPTHSATGAAELFGDGRRPWETMAEALGLGPGASMETGANTVLGNRDRVERYRRSVDRPAPTVDTKAAGAWVLNTGRDWKPGGSRDDAQRIPLTEPAPTVAASSGGQWQFRANGRGRSVTQAELAILQDLPSDLAWEACRTRGDAGRVLGNAVPLRLARALLEEVIT